jgi:hypothetical protein
VRDALSAAAPAALVGGYRPDLVDQISSLYGDFPYVLAGLAVITFILLARAFRSLLLPLKAIVANLLSVGAAYGVLVLVWQDGRGSQAIWGLPATGAITAWIPLFVFAFLFGLSMDYEVFLLTRMREEYDRTGSTDEAVVTGIGRTGRLVTSAALILFLALASGPVHVPQDLRDRRRRGHPAGRDRGQVPAGPGPGLAVRPVELVAACPCREDPPGRAVGAAIAAARRHAADQGADRLTAVARPGHRPSARPDHRPSDRRSRRAKPNRRQRAARAPPFSSIRERPEGPIKI